MKRALLALVIAVAGTAPAHAQISAAIGKPLESPDLPAGTLSVRIVAGAPSKPVIGTEVTLLVNGTPQIARTDSAGRAHFKDLPQGAQLQAKVLDDEKKEVASETFQLGATGARLMLTTLPWNPGAGGAGPMAGGAGGAGEPPNPRQMSGEPRPEPNDPPGAYTIRLSYDDFKDAPPLDVPVTLVGYNADYTVSYAIKKSDKDGRVTFDKLDRSGATAYFAMAQLPRNGVTDRLIAVPTTLDPRIGVRLILSSEKRSSTAAPVDDLTRLEKQDQPTPAGKVRVTLEGGVDGNAPVTLWDAETKLQIGRGVAQPGATDPQDTEGKPGKPEVMFDLVPRPGQTVYAETSMHGQLFRTVPFQPVAERGTHATLFIFPRILFSFSLTSRLDDEYFAVNGKFEVSNNSWVPYVASADGLIIPLPHGFTGGLVSEKDQGDVSLEPKQGFRMIRPIAPGSRQFHGAFSLPVESGKVTWALDLPFGAYNSGMEILKVPGMSVDLGASDMQGKEMTVPQGTYFVMPQISILPKKSMQMTISGLPAPAAWRIWMPRVMGIVVVVMILAGIGFAIFRSRPDEVAAAERQARRQKLLDELVELEQSAKSEGKVEKRREQIMTELEALWDQDSGRSVPG